MLSYKDTVCKRIRLVVYGAGEHVDEDFVRYVRSVPF